MAKTQVNTSTNVVFPGASPVELSDGTLIESLPDQTVSPTEILFRYSADDGATWGDVTGTVADTVAPYYSRLWVDEDDTLWLVYQEVTTSYGKLIRGTFSGSTITWDSGYDFDTSTFLNEPALKRVPVGTDDYIGIAYNDTNSDAAFLVVKRTSGGTYSTYKAKSAIHGGSVGELNIDFHHTGDGLSLGGNDPDFYIGCVETVNDDYLYWRVEYTFPGSVPTWTVGTKRTITSTKATGSFTRPNDTMLFDGTRSVMLMAYSSSPYYAVFERDEADTTTTERTGMTAVNSGIREGNLSLSVDTANQDVYVFAIDTNGDPCYEMYDRSGASWDGSLTVIDNTTVTATISNKVVHSNPFIPGKARVYWNDLDTNWYTYYNSPFDLTPTFTGTIATTNADDTSAGTGESGVEGTISSAGGFDSSFDHSFDIAAEGADISAASGEAGVDGTIAVTEADDVSAASGWVTLYGTIAVTEEDDVSAATGNVVTVGSIAVTNADDVSAAAGQVWFIGTIATTNADDVSAAAGQVWFIGTVAVTEEDDVSAASGVLKTAGTIAVTEEDDTNAASGTLVYTGTIATTNADDTSAASATLSYIFTNVTYEETFPREREDYGLYRWGWGYPVGYTVLITSGVASTYPGVTSPSHTQLEAADAYFLGGHINVVTPAQKVILDAAGYTVP